MILNIKKISLLTSLITVLFINGIRSYSQIPERNYTKASNGSSNSNLFKYHSDSTTVDSLNKALRKSIKNAESMGNSIAQLTKEKGITSIQLDRYKRSIPWSGALIGVALISFGFWGWKTAKRHTRSQKSLNTLTDNHESLKVELSDHKNDNALLNQKLKKLEEENQNLKFKYENLSSTESQDKSCFFGQALLTAGPRKSNGEKELGEDSAGFCIVRNKAFFWVLDGTSDSPIIILGRKEIMSSRLLAQHLGINLQKGLDNDIADSQKWLMDAIELTQKEWQGKISDLKEEDKTMIISRLSETAELIDVSTTAVVGIIDLLGNVSITRIGDSKIFCMNKDGELIEDDLAKKPLSQQYGRLIARASRADDETINLKLTTSQDVLRSQVSTLTGVKTVLAFSDGIGQITENFLREHFDKFPLEEVQRTTATIPQQTYDDKSLVMIQIR